MMEKMEKRERNFGVDALRCVAMLLIVCLHVMNRGGAKPSSPGMAMNMLYPLRVFASAAVNMYALISGYVSFRSRFHPARVFELWLQVLFLNVVIGLVVCLIQPGAMDGFWVRYLFPFTQKAYWYFTAYVGVYCFSPLINRAIRILNRTQAKVMVWIMLLVFSLGASLGYLGQGDPFSIGFGYSVLWLLVLYVVGACVHHAGLFEQTSAKRLLLCLLLCVVLELCLYNLMQIGSLPEDLRKKSSQLLEYTCPLITAVSLLMLLLFVRLKPGPRWRKLIAFAAPLTFGVYIIHVHHAVWIPLMGSFTFLLKLPAWLLPFAVIAAALGLFLVCLCVDFLRARLFRLLRVREAMDRLEAALRRFVYRNRTE